MNGTNKVRNKFYKRSILTSISLIILLAAPSLGIDVFENNLNENELMALWHFDEGSGSIVADSSGNNNAGTIYGANWIKQGNGYCLHFDGVDDYISIAESDSLDIEDIITLEAWIKPDAVQPTEYPTVISKHTGVNPGAQYQIGLGDEGTGYKIRFASEPLITDLSTESVILDGWNHIAVTYDGNTLTYYLNGVEDRQIPISGPLAHYNANIAIGAEPYKAWYFAGLIDEVRVYRRALSASEIKSQYENFEANKIVLDMCSLPSAQGWTYWGYDNNIGGQNAPEESVFSMVASPQCMLKQNSMYVGCCGSGSNLYRLFDVVDPQQPFIIDIRVRMLAEHQCWPPYDNHFGFGFTASTGTEVFGIGLGTNTIEDINGVKIQNDNSDFHDYRLECIPGSGYTLYIDGIQTISGSTRYLALDNHLGLGDCTGGTNAKAEILSYRFYQPLNEPPVADANGPYEVKEGSIVTLEAISSSDPDNDVLVYKWDLDDDGTFESPGLDTTFTGLDGPSTHEVALQVCDPYQECSTDDSMVTVTNVPPTPNAGSDQTVYRNDELTVHGSWTDPAVDLDNPYHWSWDLNDDGSPDETGISNILETITKTTSFTFEGSYKLVFDVEDKDGAKGSDSLIINVLNRPPDCSNARPSRNILWPPNHEFVPIEILGVTDPEGDPIAITINSIFQDEPVDSEGDGSFSPDGFGVGSYIANVRAERIGSGNDPGNGRVYHIGFTANDGHGGSTGGEVLVKVPHNSKDPIVDDGILYDSTLTLRDKSEDLSGVHSVLGRSDDPHEGSHESSPDKSEDLSNATAECKQCNDRSENAQNLVKNARATRPERPKI